MTAMVIEERAEQAWVGMHTTADLAHWDRVNAHVPRIYAALAGADEPPLGGPIYRYRRMQTSADPMDVTVSVPVAQRVELDGFASGVLPAMLDRAPSCRGFVGRLNVSTSQRERSAWGSEPGYDVIALRTSGSSVMPSAARK